VAEAANPDANIIFGASIDDTYEDQIRVTVVATGFDEKKPARAAAPSFTAAAEPSSNPFDIDLDDIFGKKNR